MMTYVKPSISAAIVVSATLICAHSSSGQDALGGGNALDANLSTGGRTNSARPQENYRDRNLLVTGDVAGGRGFRGSVGYTAASDFRGSTGSNDIYPFLAGSAYSSPALFQLGSTYEQLRFGQAFGTLEYRRAQSGAPASVNAQTPIPLRNFSEVTGTMSNYDRLRLDRTSLANSTAVNFQTLVEPQIVGLTYNKENRPFVFNASSLRGITLEPMNQSVGAIGLSTLDSVRLREDIEKGADAPVIGVPFEPTFEDKRSSKDQPLPGEGLRHNNSTSSNRINNTGANASADYTAIMRRIADRYSQSGQGQADLSQLQADFENLRTQLRGSSDPVSTRVGNRVGMPAEAKDELADQRSSTGLPTAVAPSGVTGQQDQQGVPGAGDRPEGAPVRRPASSEDSPAIPPSPLDRPTEQRPSEQRPSEQRPSEDRPDQRPPQDAQNQAQPPRTRTPAEMADVLRHGQRIESLSGDKKDRFNELMSSAEERLRHGDYFVAERSFDRALRFSPNHPLAMAGMGHAQLGGGLYLSAALTLRTLLSDHPEMIDSTFSPELLPPRERLDAVLQAVQPKLEEVRDRGSYGFLIAYIGHQLGDRALAQQGLDAMAQADAKDQLVPLLRELWLTPRALRDSKPGSAPEPQK